MVEGPESGNTKYQVKYSERPNDTLPTTLLRYERLFTAVSTTDESLTSNDKATVLQLLQSILRSNPAWQCNGPDSQIEER